MLVQEAIILAGGKGTRLQKVVSDVPKVMASVNGRPFLEYVLDYLESHAIKHVVLSVGYKRDMIRNHFGDKYKSIKISYAIEDNPLGTGGGVVNALKQIEDFNSFVFNGDTIFRLNLVDFADFHSKQMSDFSLALRQINNVERYGSVETDENNKIIRFNEKGEKTGSGLINGGVYLINKSFFNKYTFPEQFSIEKDCFEKLVGTHPFYGMTSKQYFLDIGIPEDYQKAQHDFKKFEY